MKSPSPINLTETVEKILTEYLEVHNLRRTPERFAILREIYAMQEHFDVETLYLHMKNRKYQVSRATIYNTIEHLLGCGLLTKHQFGKNLAQFEKAYANRQHDHLICQDCDKVFEFCDPRIQQIQNTMGELLQFNVTKHSLNLYGRCKKLEEEGICGHHKTKNR